MINFNSNDSFKEYESLANKILAEKPCITLYGGGNTANACIPVFSSLGLNIKIILDKSPFLIGTQCHGINIIHPDDYQDTQSVIVICVFSFKDIEKELNKKGFFNILPYFFYLLNNAEDQSTNIMLLKSYYDIKWKYSKPKYGVLDTIDIPITEKCSLKCKDCSNLMQYFAKPKHADFAQLISAAKRLLNAIDYCYEIRILGGEPFVNLQWHNYVKSLEECSDKFSWISIYTNATILPTEKAIKDLPLKKLFVRISDYGNSKQKIEESMEFFNKHKISVFVSKIFQWQNCGILKKYNRSFGENIGILKECCVKDTPVVADGKFFRCPYAASAWLLKAIPADKFKYVNLLNPELTDLEIKQQVQNIIDGNDARICDWCGGRPITGSYIEPALQTDKPLRYESY
jgi:uncharacterized Fe-S cluster-containing radical SAM superfamily protein